jgi:hypothetical protein
MLAAAPCRPCDIFRHKGNTVSSAVAKATLRSIPLKQVFMLCRMIRVVVVVFGSFTHGLLSVLFLDFD